MQAPTISPEQRHELALLLLYLNSWQEEPHVRQAWKNHDFAALDALAEQDFISTNRRSKSVYLTKAGEEKAIELAHKFFSKY